MTRTLSINMTIQTKEKVYTNTGVIYVPKKVRVKHVNEIVPLEQHVRSKDEGRVSKRKSRPPGKAKQTFCGKRGLDISGPAQALIDDCEGSMGDRKSVV